jgi:SAM-dependent methyltransferase
LGRELADRRARAQAPVEPRLLSLLLRPAFRVYETLKSLRPYPRVAADLPPARLRVRVAGTADPSWFLESGRLTAETVGEALDRHGATGALLDFGCGCGRVIRHWRGRDDLHGCDRDAEAIRWCRDHLLFARFERHGLAPPLPYPGRRFGAVSAISVFTHLPEEAQARWRAELHRVLAPEGVLVLTTHGDRYVDRFSAEERSRFDAGELVVRRPGAAGTNLCTAFHPEQYVRKTLAEGFELLEFKPGGATGTPTQDLAVLRVVRL